MTDVKHYTYRVSWSPEDDEFVASCAEFPSLSWLADSQTAALEGLATLVAEVVEDLQASGESVPDALAERRYSGRFNVRVPESLHRELAVKAAEEGVSLNRLVSDRLART
ncbi:MAG: toxin-antitoxin system HicB family antitoxin [Nitriliruptor sp.]|uniref:type II toxin-antitoxin system HicB family antitoxin n=1 Tax=Nitriliruptor sp. TaxID=2448056 RepID=UPI0034A0A132